MIFMCTYQLDRDKQAETQAFFADKSLKKDKDVVLAAVKESGHSLEFADKSLKKDKDILKAAI